MIYSDIYKNEGRNPLFLHPTNIRFKEVSDIVSGDVLDVGCGHGGLRGYLEDCEYTGIDGTAWVAKLSGNIHCDLFDYHKTHDWVVALGVLETCDDLQKTANKLKSLAVKGLIFSFHVDCRAPFKKYHKLDMVSVFGDVSIIQISKHEYLGVLHV